VLHHKPTNGSSFSIWQNLHSHLQKEHKLKHWGRLQYGLFLKGAGLDLEGSQQFWERHFTRVMTHDQFVKGYAYSFRHMYGKEGARKNYTPFSCLKIIMGAPPEIGGFHGCPYR
jgi:DNA primase large subunit